MCRARRVQGFTLIELMLVVAIVSLLAAIAIPKFANLILKAKQAELKARLGCIRSAISIYYADNEGMLPQVTNEVTPNPYTDPSLMGQWIFCLHPKYLGKINLWVGEPVVPHSISAKWGVDIPMAIDWNVFNWVWIYNPPSARIYINCTHTDLTGRVWSTW